VPMEGVVDVAAEIDRLAKDIEKSNQECQRLAQKLENPKFVERAPEAVVAAEREKLQAAQEAMATLTQQQARLKAL